MKTRMIWKRKQPTRTARLFKEIDAPGTATISENTPNDAFEPLADAGYKEVSREKLFEAAAAGYDVWYKTASLGGRSRFYVYLGSQHVERYVNLAA